MPRRSMMDVYGLPGSGRTSLLHLFLAAASRQGEYCALVDATDSFDPHSAAAAGVDLTRLLWVRCNRNVPKTLQCTDLLLHSGGWGMIVMDLSDIAPAMVRRVPISYWHRFRRAIENTPGVLLVMEQEPYARGCSALAIEMKAGKPLWSGGHADYRVLRGTQCSMTQRKPVCQETATLQTRALAV